MHTPIVKLTGPLRSAQTQACSSKQTYTPTSPGTDVQKLVSFDLSKMDVQASVLHIEKPSKKENENIFHGILYESLWEDESLQEMYTNRALMDDDTRTKIVTMDTCKLLWMHNLGHGFGTTVSLIHHADAVDFLDAIGFIFWAPSVLKMARFRVAETFYDLVPPTTSTSDGAASVLDRATEVKIGVNYFGNKSYQRLFQARLLGEGSEGSGALLSAEFLSIALSEEEEIAEFRNQCLAALNRTGRNNIKPEVSSFPAGTLQPVYSSTMVVTDNCIDHLNHANFKVYFIKAFDTLRRAVDEGCIGFQYADDLYHAKVKEVANVYEHESLLGQTLTFVVFRPVEGSSSRLYVAAYFGNQRNCYITIDFYETVSVKHASHL